MKRTIKIENLFEVKILEIYVLTSSDVKIRYLEISPTSDFANGTFANVFGRLANAMSRLANILLVTLPMY